MPVQTRRKTPKQALDAQDSPLLNLPGELRNRIYSNALHPSETVRLRDWPPLLRTSRQVRDEATSIYYLDQYFVTVNSCRTLRLTDLVQWFKLLGPQKRGLLRYIFVLRVHGWHKEVEEAEQDLDELHASLVKRGVGVPKHALYLEISPACCPYALTSSTFHFLRVNKQTEKTEVCDLELDEPGELRLHTCGF